ncbi:glycosyltransferase [Vreelandella aquamarina]|uniref:glycosyltransferase n=1 Tax=Vreelandella aquamarina TaxID=77097 RepID=UPI00384F0854
MIKILYIVSTLKRSGPTSQLYNIIKQLDRTQFDPCLITLSPEPIDSRWEDFEELEVQLHTLGLSRIAGLFSATKNLNHMIEVMQPDLIHSQGIRGDMLSAGLSIGLPRVCTVRNIPQQDYRMTYGLLQARWMVGRHRIAMKMMDKCVGVSHVVSENLRANLGVQNACTIQNGVDTEIYTRALCQEKSALRKKLGLPLAGRIWITSGHLNARKDPLFLIDAWKGACVRKSDDSLIFIGSGSLDGECWAAAEQYSNVFFLGRVSNVADYLKASDYFLSASKAEGLPNAVLEALACGLPALLSDIEPHREIWEMDKNIGDLFLLGDHHSFKSSLAAIVKKERQTLSDAALDLINARLSAQKMSEKYQIIYKELVNCP